MDPMERVRAKLIFRHVFFAALLCPMKVVATDEVERAATDMEKIYYNPEWFAQQTLGVQEFTYIHEGFHPLALHDVREQGRDHDLWNIAGDHEINLQLKAAGFEIWSKACCDHRFTGMSAERIYEILKKENEEAEKNGQPKPHGKPGGLGTDMRPRPMTEEEASQKAVKVRRQIAQAATMAKQAGQMSSDLERFVNSILHPATPWWDQLALIAKRVVRENESWSTRNRRFQDIYLPGLRSHRMGEIIIIDDTSGSISDKDLQLFGGIAMDTFEELRPSSIRVIYWDSRFKGEEIFQAGERPELHPVGGGGTAMDKALLHVEENFEPEACILITDCETPWPDHEMPFPLIVLSTTEKEAPIGTTIHVST